MLYFIKDFDQEFGEVFTIVGISNSDGSNYLAKDLLNKNYWSLVENLGLPSLYAPVSIDRPVFCFPVAQAPQVFNDTMQAQNITAFMEKYKSILGGSVLNDPTFEKIEIEGAKQFSDRRDQLIAVFAKALGDEKLTSTLVDLGFTYFKWIYGKSDITLSFDLFKRFTHTTNLNVKSISDQVTQVVSTNHMKDCTDTLMIKLASLYDLDQMDFENYVELLPVVSDIITQYSNPGYESPQFRQVIGLNTSIYNLICGTEKNSKLDLYENEEKFAEYVRSWIQDGINNHSGVDELGNKIASKTITPICQEYLLMLIEQIYMGLWKHAVAVPLEFASVKDSNLGGSYVFKKELQFDDEHLGNMRNACVTLRNFLEDAMAKHSSNYEILVRALIQICRWGERKPSHILTGEIDSNGNVTEIDKQIFNLNTGEIETSSLMQGEVVEIDTDKFNVLAEITVDKGGENILIGYLKETKLRDEVGAEFTQGTLISIPELLLDFAGTNVRIPERVQSIDYSNIQNLKIRTAFYESTEVSTFKMSASTKMKVPFKDFSLIAALASLINLRIEKPDYERCRVRSANEMFSVSDATYYDYSILSYINIFEALQDFVIGLNADTTVEDWKNELAQHQLNFEFLDGKGSVVSSAVSSTNTSPSTAFSAAPVEKSAPVVQPIQSVAQATPSQPKQRKVFVEDMAALPKDGKYLALMCGGNQVGTVYSYIKDFSGKQKPVYILLDECSEATAGEVKIEMILAFVVSCLPYIEDGKSDLYQVFFQNDTARKKLREALAIVERG